MKEKETKANTGRSPIARTGSAEISANLIDWDQLRIFHAVVETGSFTKAGRKLRIAQSSISRQVAELERKLRISLFHRHSSGLVLTDAGQTFEQTATEIFSQLSKGLAQINDYREIPRGPLRITTSIAFGSAWLTLRMTEFRKLYPDIAVTLFLTDDLTLDLSLSQADIAIRFADQTQPNLIQRHLMTIQFQFFASKEYIAKRGEPKNIEELDQHDIVIYGDEMPAPVQVLNWLPSAGKTTADKPREATLRVSSTYAIFQALLSGLGIGALPYYLSEGSKLVRVLRDVKGPQADAYLVYPEELKNSRRIAVLTKFLIEAAKKDSKLRGG